MVLACQFPELQGQFRVDDKGGPGAAIVLLQWAYTVCGQFQQGRRSGKMRLPVIKLALQQIALQPLALPYRVVRVLKRQGCERVRLPFLVGGIQGRQLTSQDTHRPAVGHDMVHGEQQHVFLFADSQQSPADQVPRRQIERGADFLGGMTPDLLFAFRRRQIVEVDLGDIEAARVLNSLHGVTVIMGKYRSQDLVPFNESIQRGLQCRPVEFAHHAQCTAHVVGGIALFHLLDEP